MIREKCARMLSDRDEAQDVAQETFVRLWRSGAVVLDPPALTAWVYRTSTRLAVDRLRQRGRLVNVAEPPEGSVPGAADSLEARGELERIARTVPAAELQAAILHRFDRMGQQEVAEVLGSSERTVRRLLERFDRRMKETRE